MGDINMGQSGPHNADVFSPNSGDSDTTADLDFSTDRDFVSPTNTDAEHAGEIADTDNYRGANENSIIQEAQEELAESSPPAEITEAMDIVNESFALMDQLEAHHRRISARGIGLTDVAALESMVPGILIPNAKQTFTYKPSDRNLTYSQEAIADKLKAVGKAAYKAILTVINWIIETAKKIYEKLKNGRFKKQMIQFNVLLRSRAAVLSFDEIDAMLDGKAEDYYATTIGIDYFNHCFSSNLSVDDFKGLKRGSTIPDFLKMISNKPGKMFDVVGQGKLGSKLYDECHAMNSWLSDFGRMLDRTASEDRWLAPTNAEKLYKTDNLPVLQNLHDLAKIDVADEKYVEQMAQEFSILSKVLNNIKRRIDSTYGKMREENPDAFAEDKDIRKAYYDGVRYFQKRLANYNMATYQCSAVIGTANRFIYRTTKGNVIKFHE